MVGQRNRLLWFAVVGLAAGIVRTAAAQNYVLAPDDQSRFPDDPRLLNPQAYTNPILFDTVLDPSAGSRPLPRAAKDILISHRIAQQQVDLAIAYLEANRERILAGEDRAFLSVFGNIAAEQPAAMLEPSNTRLGQSAVVGGVTVGGGGYTLQPSGTAVSLWASQLRPGDWIAVDLSGAPTTGASQGQPGRTFERIAIIRRVERVVVSSSGVTIYLDRNGAPLPSSGTAGGTTINLQNAALSKVLVDRNRKPYFMDRAQTEVLDQVVETFKAIRSALAGYDPSNPGGQRHAIRYNGQFKKFTDVWGPGDGLFTHSQLALDQSPPDMPSWYSPSDPAYATKPAFIPDRRLREAGFSTSNSRDHIDAVMADRFGIPTRYDPDTDRPLSPRGYQQRPDKNWPPIRPGVVDALPLLWTEDNDSPQNAFFNQRQLLFTLPNLIDPITNAIEVYVGPRFYSGPGFVSGGDGVPRLLFVDRRFDEWRTIAGSVSLELKGITDPYGTDRIPDNIGLLAKPPALQFDWVPRPGSGSPRVLRSVFRQWQLILREFSEWTTNFGRRSTTTGLPDYAVIGLNDMVTRTTGIFKQQWAPPSPGQDLSFLALDADKYARFAGLINVSASDSGGSGAAVLELPRKRGVAGFFPVVFRR